jgi:hypothetical protein
MDSNADVSQLKLLVDPLSGECWRRREKLTLIFFGVTTKKGFKKLFFRDILEIL